jgi:peptidoglycan/xylan/chitin deacetylase (PgdA/CDA1 family)
MLATLALVFTSLASNALSTPLPLARRVPTGQIITQCTTPNTVALTFDDGPSEYTPQLLDLLSRYSARATFFVLGDAAAQNPGLLQRMRDEGHQVSAHTYAHPLSSSS